MRKLAEQIIDKVKEKQNEKDEYGHYRILPSPEESIDDIVKLIDNYVKIKNIHINRGNNE